MEEPPGPSKFVDSIFFGLSRQEGNEGLVRCHYTAMYPFGVL